MALPFEIDARFLTEEHVGKDGLSPVDIEKYRARGARCLREMRKAQRSGELPRFARDRRIHSTLREIRSHTERLLKGGCESLVILGMGGSVNGARAITDALLDSRWNERTKEARGGRPRLYYLDSIDPDEVASLLDIVDPRTATFVLVSKSGNTAEVIANYLVVERWLEEKDKDHYKKRIVVITGPDPSFLRKRSEANGYRIINLPEKLGGRFSVFTAAGLFAAAMVGIDIGRIVDGAIEVENLCTESNIDANPALRAALLYYLMDFRRKNKNHVLFHYSGRLGGFANWFRQLWAESLGKTYSHTGKEVRAGTLPVPARGPADQHSLLQLLVEGPKDKVVTFLAIDSDRSELRIPEGSDAPAWLAGRTLNELRRYQRIGTTYALASVARPSLTVRINRLDEFSLGALFFFWELVVAYLATLYSVNAYDQPAVDLGKLATQSLLGDEEQSVIKDDACDKLGLEPGPSGLPVETRTPFLSAATTGSGGGGSDEEDEAADAAASDDEVDDTEDAEEEAGAED